MSVRRRNHETDGVLSNSNSSVVSNYLTEDYVRGQVEAVEFPARWVISVLLLCLTGTVVIIPILALSIPPSPRTGLPWWRVATIYHLLPRAFHDSDGDGVGDLPGVTSQLNALSGLGVSGLRLGPLFQSSHKADGAGYDVTDFMGVDPLFGTLAEFDELIERAHRQGLAVMLDLVPNHSSKEHPWFQSSLGSPTGAYSDYYIWHDGIVVNGTRQFPNNWNCMYGGPAWTWSDARQQYYFHQYSSHHPDLNFRNPRVRTEMNNVLQFWLDHGVDGIYINSVDLLYEKERVLLNEKRSCDHKAKPDEYSYLQHVHSSGQPEVHHVLKEWRKIINKHMQRTGKEIFFSVDVLHQDDLSSWQKYYISADLPSNAALVRGLMGEGSGADMSDLVASYNALVPRGDLLSWHIGTPETKRASSIRGSDYAEVLNMMNVLLPGPTFVYFGEELGLEQPPHSFQHAVEAVKVQNGDPSSVLSAFKELLLLNQQAALQWGWMELGIANENIFSFFRTAKGWSYRKYLIAVNIGETSSKDNYHSVHTQKFTVKRQGTVAYVTKNFGEKSTKYTMGQKVDLENLELGPSQGVVIAF